MDELLRKHRVHVYQDMDRVILMVGNLQVEIPYVSSFKIAQALRLASKDAMRYAKEDVTNWRSMAALNDLPDQTTSFKVSPEQRITVNKDFPWGVKYEGEDIKVVFGNNHLKFHFVVALKLSQWLRIAGKKAKSWAGDGGKSIIAASILSDAEENYRLGVK